MPKTLSKIDTNIAHKYRCRKPFKVLWGRLSIPPSKSEHDYVEYTRECKVDEVFKKLQTQLPYW